MSLTQHHRHASLEDLLLLARTIWGDDRLTLRQVVERAMVTLGDLARLSRDGVPQAMASRSEYQDEIQKEIGNLIFSCIRWADDLGYDPVRCVELAAKAQHRFASSGRPR